MSHGYEDVEANRWPPATLGFTLQWGRETSTGAAAGGFQRASDGRLTESIYLTRRSKYPYRIEAEIRIMHSSPAAATRASYTTNQI